MASAHLLQGGRRTLAVARVAVADLLQKGVHTSTQSFFHQLLIAPSGTLRGVRGEEDFEGRVGENDRCPCRARRRPGRAAARKARWRSSSASPHRRQRRDPRGGAAHALRREWRRSRRGRPARSLLAVEVARPGRARSPATSAASSRSTPRVERRQRDQPVERAAVEEVEAERVGDLVRRPCPCRRPRGRRSR